jgi:hypothetical protein
MKINYYKKAFGIFIISNFGDRGDGILMQLFH